MGSRRDRERDEERHRGEGRSHVEGRPRVEEQHRRGGAYDRSQRRESRFSSHREERRSRSRSQDSARRSHDHSGSSRADRHQHQSHSYSSERAGGQEERKQPPREEKVDLSTVDADDDEAIAKAMGFGGFASTKGTQVPGNTLGAVDRKKKVDYRQMLYVKRAYDRPLTQQDLQKKEEEAKQTPPT